LGRDVEEIVMNEPKDYAGWPTPDLKVGESYRFIQLEDKKFEFELVEPFSRSHCGMAKDRKVIGAGYITIFANKVRMDDPWSSSLNVGCSAQCESDLSVFLGKKVVGKWE
jgi:hypothetical protein